MMQKNLISRHSEDYHAALSTFTISMVTSGSWIRLMMSIRKGRDTLAGPYTIKKFKSNKDILDLQ